MVKDEAFRDFLKENSKNLVADEDMAEMLNGAAEYSSLMLSKAIDFLSQTHSVSEEVYIANLAALMLATSDDLDSAIRSSKIIIQKLSELDNRYSKSE